MYNICALSTSNNRLKGNTNKKGDSCKHEESYGTAKRDQPRTTQKAQIKEHTKRQPNQYNGGSQKLSIFFTRWDRKINTINIGGLGSHISRFCFFFYREILYVEFVFFSDVEFVLNTNIFQMIWSTSWRFSNIVYTLVYHCWFPRFQNRVI